MDGAAVVFGMAGEKSRFPGAVNVTDGGPYSEGVFYGRVHVEGRFERARSCSDAVVEIVPEFATDPASMAAKHGRLTGNCCFCCRRLSHERSAAVGYGEICASQYGLPWGEKEDMP